MFRFGKNREKTEQGVQKTRQAWFGQVAQLFRGAAFDEALWDELEELLISADVGVATTARLLSRLKERVQQEKPSDPEGPLKHLKDEMVSILEVRNVDLERGPALYDGVFQPPMVLLVVGVNGVGKTTSIAKLAHRFKEEGLSVILGAADTFRAAGVEQLEAWGRRVGADVIAHRQGSDPGAVAFDTMLAARSRNIDVAIIDTAGRLHTKGNLMEEMKKVQRVLSREQGEYHQYVLLTLDATTGQNGLVQARAFIEAVSCDGVVLAKLDGTAKGGIVLAICDELKLPVLYIATGESLEDLAPFDAREFVEALFQPG